jgi:AbrB family looped-hinge helix DNA binding protein
MPFGSFTALHEINGFCLEMLAGIGKAGYNSYNFLTTRTIHMETVKLSSKGQFILPKAIRDRHHWEAGTEFIIIDRGAELVIKPTKVFPATELEPSDTPSVYQGKSLSDEEMRRAVMVEAGKHK